jgi:hypothetical protein
LLDGVGLAGGVYWPAEEAMKGFCGVSLVLAAALCTIASGPALAQQTPPPAFTLDGEIALWTMSIKADKTADFERIMAKLREGLAKSTNAARRQQLAGWKVMRVKSPLPDGNIAYVHVINPVVPGADYTIMQTLYDEFPDERQQLYDLYRGAFVANLSLAPGAMALDMSRGGSGASGQ